VGDPLGVQKEAVALWVNLEPKTKQGCEQIISRHLLPTFGRRKVASITHEVVQDYISGLAASGLAPGTVRSIYTALRLAIGAGVKAWLVKINPCSGIDLPRPRRRKPVFLTAEQVGALADAITPRYRVLIYTAAYTGLRWGELGALRVRDVKLGRLEVNEALKEVDGELSFGPTKTHANRAVSLPAFLRDMLAEHLAGRPADPAALFFTGPDGGPLRHSGFYRRHFKPAVRAALPPEVHRLRFHDLRHTCVALLIAAGAQTKAIQARLGHSTSQMTLDVYGHLLPSLDDDLAATLDATHAAASSPAANVVALR
jgi:integrase